MSALHALLVQTKLAHRVFVAPGKAAFNSPFHNAVDFVESEPQSLRNRRLVSGGEQELDDYLLEQRGEPAVKFGP